MEQERQLLAAKLAIICGKLYFIQFFCSWPLCFTEKKNFEFISNERAFHWKKASLLEHESGNFNRPPRGSMRGFQEGKVTENFSALRLISLRWRESFREASKSLQSFSPKKKTISDRDTLAENRVLRRNFSTGSFQVITSSESFKRSFLFWFLQALFYRNMRKLRCFLVKMFKT